nr:unnamed protein product [Callosobruchus analis]
MLTMWCSVMTVLKRLFRFVGKLTLYLRYGFHLRKWISSIPEIVTKIGGDDSSEVIEDFGEKGTTKTLGLYWAVSKDMLNYCIKLSTSLTLVTKRTILSEISRIFDPLGLISPCVILVKILLQELWVHKLSWEDTVPSGIAEYWKKLRSDFYQLETLNIQRQIVCREYSSIQLHGFCDVSSKAYGAAVYLRSVDASGSVQVSLVAAKSSVAPLKALTIPRLELCGALVLVELVQRIKGALTLKIDSIYLWCDTTVVLSWIATSPHLLQTFVSNRVAKIQELSQGDGWYHVKTDENPADLVSRGVSPGKLIHNELWFNGPSWLTREEDSWCKKDFSVLSDVPEMKKQCQVLHVAQSPRLIDFRRFSGFQKLVRSFAYCLRFSNNTRRKPKWVGHLTSSELESSLHSLLKLVQKETFSEELRALEKGSPVKPARLLPLTPFMDPSGLLRVGGRLALSDLSYESKHQILLPSKHWFVQLLFIHEHEKLLHGGPQLLLATICEKYWPIGGRELARKVVHKCVKCFRSNPKHATQIMGVLPEHRVQPMPPFYAVGIDFAGPVLIKSRAGRGCKLLKAYIAVFVCFSTKAVYLDLVSDLTSSAFIACLRRFVCRRGKPRYVYSDNGRNFVGAHSELKELRHFLQTHETELIETFERENIIWKFIPAHAPNFGGLWEAGVKSCKYYIKRVIGLTSLTFEEYSTLLAQIEAVLNSRPLTPMSCDPNDLDVLTPGHFLLGRRLTSVPDREYRNVPENRLTRYQHIQKMYQHFWSRWKKEYLMELQNRQKWQHPQPNLCAGQMVVLREDNTPPLLWKLGRIVEVVPGPDRLCRVVKVRTSTGILRRPVTKVCVLPVEDVSS